MADDRPTPPPAPDPERRPTVLSDHGEDRVDDWYWLAERDDPAVMAHLRAENAYAEAVTAPLDPLRRQLFEEMVARIAQSDLAVPVRRGPWWYYQRTAEGAGYPIHCRRPARADQDPPLDPSDADEQVLLDENQLAEVDGYLAVTNLVVSPDHRWLAYAVDTTGSERYQLRFRMLDPDRLDQEQEAPAPEVVADTSYGLAWADDNRTVFYTRMDDAMRPYQLWRHRLGHQPDDDVLVLEERDERFVLQPFRTNDGALIMVELHSTTTSEAWSIAADAPLAPLEQVWPRRSGVECHLTHWAHPGGGPGWLLALTNDDAEDFRLLGRPAPGGPGTGWEELVPHRSGVRLDDVEVFDHHLVLGERIGGEACLRVVPLPDDLGPGPELLGASWLVPSADHPSTTWAGPNPEPASPTLRFEQSSLVSPRAVFDVPVAGGAPVLRKRQPVLGGYDPAAYRTLRLDVPVDDGVTVPVSVVHRADLLADRDAPSGTAPAAPAPCLLYGYGAYEHSIDPVFSSLRLSLLDRGFVFAVAHVRGGGELGRHWYEEGKLLHKRRTFTDFIACARRLVDLGFTTPDLLAARGASAGGLLIGAVANAAPELFAALVAEVPFVDCLTTMLDASLPLTVGEWEEWGNPKADPAAYAAIRSYSPYDNVRSRAPDGTPVRYPSILATAGLNDSRVGYWEPAKWVAKIRAANPANRVLLRTELGAGHGGPSSRYDAWRDEAFVYAFVLDALNLA
ncbi:MAG TPA: S9 family peptidase [Acidimicrobiales bacterium]